MYEKSEVGEVATFINGYAFKPQDWSSEGKEIIRIQNLTKTSKEINYYSSTIDKNTLLKMEIFLFLVGYIRGFSVVWENPQC